jgi:hypothetical protein
MALIAAAGGECEHNETKRHIPHHSLYVWAVREVRF